MAYTFTQGDRPLEGYTIQRGVGRGGFGEVYHAVSDGGKEVALKYLRENAQVELRGVAHCLNLKSPYLVTLYDVRQSADGEWFVVMEYVAGPSLRDLLIDSPKGLGPQKAAFIFKELVKGLTYLHDRGIVHRDLKPGNIFYEDGYVKIVDYGLSKSIAQSQHSGQTVSVGTVHYMAPEIGTGNYSHSVDIYAAGVILYEMLLGVVPFRGASTGEVLMKHLTAQPEVDALPAPFPDVIRKALAKDPRDRYQSVGEMVRELFAEDDLERSVAAFEPQSLSTIAARQAPRLNVPIAGGSSNINALNEPRQPVAPPPVTPQGRAHAAAAEAAAMASTAAALEAATREGSTRQRMAASIAIVVSIATVAAFASSRFEARLEQIPITLGMIAAMVGGTLLGTRMSLSLYLPNEWARRGIASAAVLLLLLPALAIASAFAQVEPVAWAIPLLAWSFFGDIEKRIRLGAAGGVSWGAAFAAGLGVYIVSAMMTQSRANFGVACVAGASSIALELVSGLWPTLAERLRQVHARRMDSHSKSGSHDLSDVSYAGSGSDRGSSNAVRIDPNAVTRLANDDPTAYGRHAVRPSQEGRAPQQYGASGVPLRVPGVRLAWSIAGLVGMAAGIAMFIVGGAAVHGDHELATLVAPGVALELFALFAFSRAVYRRRLPLWSGYLRPAAFTACCAAVADCGIVLGLINLGSGEFTFAVILLVMAALAALVVWFLPAPFGDRVPDDSQFGDDELRRRKHGKNCMVAGASIITLVYAVVLPLLLALLDSDRSDILPAALIPSTAVGFIFLVTGWIILYRSGNKARRKEKLRLPLRRSYTVPAVSGLGELIQRHFLMLGYRPVTNSRLLWSFERGQWASNLYSSDIRAYRTTINIAAYEVASGYRIDAYLEVQLGWNHASQREIRLLADEIDDLESVLLSDPSRGEAVTVSRNAQA